MKKVITIKTEYKIMRFPLLTFFFVFLSFNFFALTASGQEAKPNILWIITEDQSPHISCYGEKAITTPHLDKMAAEGIRFDNAFVTSPVCSPSRSAMVTGMYQTVLGTHNHRSQRKFGDRDSSSKPYADTYVLPVPSVWELFEANGYYVCNDGKSDYNWSNQILYNKGTWEKRPEGQPFFAQVQLKGGKVRGSGDKLEDPVATTNVDLPPYYPDTPLFREWWADYLDSWLNVDKQVAELMERLNREELLDNTIIFFITDHGISSLRGKQYLYDEGISVPLIIRFPDKKMAGTVRKDLVLQIDLVPTSLKVAGIEVPEYIQGKDLLGKNYKERDFIVTARDRCGDAVDIIRSIRTSKYKYIRNFMSYRPHSQRDQYKDNYAFTKTMRKLNAQGELNELQSQFFTPVRPPEELYDLENDPFETKNLANMAAYQEILFENRNRLYSWMIENKDLGLIPEPILEELGKKYGNKYAILQQKENDNLVRQLIDVIEAGEWKDIPGLEQIATTGNPGQRYWALTWLGVHENKSSEGLIKELTEHDDSSVRIAACLALCRIGCNEPHLSQLAEAINNPNYLTGMYAIRAIEQTGILNETTSRAAEIASSSKYDNTSRFGRRLLHKMGLRQESYYDEFIPENYAYLYKSYSQNNIYLKQKILNKITN